MNKVGEKNISIFFPGFKNRAPKPARRSDSAADIDGPENQLFVTKQKL